MFTRLGICAILVMGLCASAAWSAPLLPGGTLFPAPAEPDPVGGVVVGALGPVPFAAASFSGTLTTTVIAGDATNALGGLTFTYLVTNNAASPNAIGRVTAVDFTGWATDASFQPGPGVPAALVDRLSPDVVGFAFYGAPVGAGQILPGQASTLLVVQTNAPAFMPAMASVIDGSVTMVPSLGPTIPEPATLSLLALGGLLLARRRRG